MGKLSLPLKNQEKYETGQLFLHRVFGYRGVILFPWRAKVYDRNSYVSTTTADSTDKSTPSSPLGSSSSSSTTSDADSSAINASDTTQTEAKKDEDSTSHTNEDAHETSGNNSGDSSDDDLMSARRVGSKEITVNVQTYYQVLIDSRDCPHVVQSIFP